MLQTKNTSLNIAADPSKKTDPRLIMMEICSVVFSIPKVFLSTFATFLKVEKQHLICGEINID